MGEAGGLPDGAPRTCLKTSGSAELSEGAGSKNRLLHVLLTCSKFFSEAEMKSFYRILPEIDLDDFINPDDMVEMVEKYPEISEKQAETIIQRIQKTGKEIKHLKNKPDARQRGGR